MKYFCIFVRTAILSVRNLKLIEMKKLIGMTDFVLEQDLDTPKGRKASEMVRYGLFIKQPLELWMFVPCDLVMGKVIVLEKPLNYELYFKKTLNVLYSLDLIKYEKYQQAKERCLFEGFEYNSEEDIIFILKKDHYIQFDPDELKGENIESLVQWDLELTQTAQKQLGWI